MKIQQITPEYQRLKVSKGTSKVSSPVIKGGLQSDVVSFSSKKPKKAGLIKTLAVSVGLLSVLTGCVKPKVQPPVNNQDTGVVVGTADAGFSSSGEYTENNIKAGELGFKLLGYGDKLTYYTAEKEINNFFSENGITNVTIKDISKSPEIPSTLMGAFIPKYNNLEYDGGTMYIGRPQNFSDQKEQLKYAEEVSHELTHVLQFHNDRTNQGIKGLVSSNSDAEKIFKAVNDYKQTKPVNYVRNAALSDYVCNSMTNNERQTVIDNIGEYGMAFYNKKIDITSDYIKKSVTEMIAQDSSGNFENTVNNVTDMYLDDFVKNYNVEDSKASQMKQALLADIIFNYKAEAEAYRTSTKVEEAAFGINGDSLSDFVPKTYDEVVKVLEKKYSSEYGN